METPIVVALCTRNRPEDLLRACHSISRSCARDGVRVRAALVVDAGPLGPSAVGNLVSDLGAAAARVEHLDVSTRVRSLYQSRLVALRRARELGASHVAFFDDDVELMPDYMGRLAALLAAGPPAAVGGLDLDLRVPGRASRLWGRFVGTSSGDPARLSSAGFSGSMPLWIERDSPFPSEFASGCNMTLDVRVLERVSPEAERRFETYSLGEDLYLWNRAGSLGETVVDPRLQVRHRRAPRSREGRVESGRQFLVNHAWLVRALEPPRSPGRFAWSAFWIALRELARDFGRLQPRGRAFGMLSGAREAARLLTRP